MKEQETIEGVVYPQQSDVVAELLRDRLATKLTEDELTSLINEVAMLSQSGEEDRVSRLKSSVDYIEYKCREIERALRATDRHVRPRDRDRRERVFRDRSPIGVMAFGSLSDGLMYAHKHASRSGHPPLSQSILQMSM